MTLKNTILLFVIYFLFTFSVLGQVKFNFTSDEHDFGVAEEGTNLTYAFEFTNTGKDTIHLKEETRDVRPGCSCTASEYSKEAVPPGAKGFIKAGYNTSGRIGPFTKTITISQKGAPYYIITIKGVVIKKAEKVINNTAQLKKFPIFVIDKKSHNFGKIEKGQRVTQKFILKNAGKDTLKITSAHSACQCLSYKLLNSKDNSMQKFILPGKTAYLEINYMPAATQALSDLNTHDIITLFTNDPNNEKIEISLGAEIIESLINKSPVK